MRRFLTDMRFGMKVISLMLVPVRPFLALNVVLAVPVFAGSGADHE